jgi:tRNA A-37 threonylcarbamoyl transferase component Bud32
MTPSTDFVTLDNGQLTASAEFLPTLRKAGLDSFDAIMALSAQSVVRAVPGRSTVRIELPSLVGYLKRYEASYLTFTEGLLRAVHWPGADDEAGREWRKILLLRQHGFLTATPVAMGQQRCSGIVVASFLLQQEIAGGVPADECLPKQSVVRRRRLLTEIGRLARRLRDAGFIHKDLYLKHIFVVDRGAARDLYLIDLQRVLGPRRHRERWYLKDAAALAFSVRAHAHGSRTDLMRLYKAYASGETDKSFIRKVWRRVERLLLRTPKYKRVWNS